MMGESLTAMAVAARGGDDHALAGFLAAAEPLLRRRASQLVEPSAVDDVVQESLLEVHQSIGALRCPAAVVAWLVLVVRKHADRHHRRRRQSVLLDLVADVLPAPEDGPERAVERASDAAAIRRALALAADRDRLILTLRYFAEWSDAELASLLGISRGAVRKRLHDARRRIRPVLEAHYLAPSTHASEEVMSNVHELIGRRLNGEARPPLPPPPAMYRPDTLSRLATGLKAIDAVAPWPAGGTIDLLGPVGTGHLVLLAEVVHNLKGVLVAVGAMQPAADGSSARLHKLLDPDARGIPAIVIDAPDNGETAAIDYACRAAALLAAEGQTVLLAVDRVVADFVGEKAFAHLAGAAAHGTGIVSTIRVAPHTRDAMPPPAWAGQDAVTVLSLTEALAGRFPAIDFPACRSAVLDLTDERTRAVARACHDVLTSAARVRDYLTQPLWMAEPAAGTPGQRIDPNDATTGLAQALGPIRR